MQSADIPAAPSLGASELPALFILTFNIR